MDTSDRHIGRLLPAVDFAHVPVLGACLPRVMRSHRQDLPVTTLPPSVELAPEFGPALVQDGLVQTRLGSDVLARGIGRAFGQSAHVLDGQVLHHNQRASPGQLAGRFVKQFLPGVRNSGVHTPYTSLAVLSVGRALDLACHASLLPCQSRLVVP